MRVLASGVSFTDALIRAGTYLGGPKPPFTPGYELVGVVEELGPGCSSLRKGDRVGALTVWGANAERVCVPRARARELARVDGVVPGDRGRRAVGPALAVPACSASGSRSLRIDHQDWFREDFGVLLELLRRGEIHPVVAERLPLSDVRRAHELLEQSASKGKLVLVPEGVQSAP